MLCTTRNMHSRSKSFVSWCALWKKSVGFSKTAGPCSFLVGCISFWRCFSTAHASWSFSLIIVLAGTGAPLDAWEKFWAWCTCVNRYLRASGLGSSHMSRSRCCISFIIARAVLVINAPITIGIVRSATCSQASVAAWTKSPMPCTISLSAFHVKQYGELTCRLFNSSTASPITSPRVPGVTAWELRSSGFSWCPSVLAGFAVVLWKGSCLRVDLSQNARIDLVDLGLRLRMTGHDSSFWLPGPGLLGNSMS